MAWRYATTFVLPTAITGSTDQPEHPVTNVGLTTGLLTRPRRTYWTDNITGEKVIDFDFGSAKVIAIVQIDNTNAATIELRGGASPAPATVVLASLAVPYDAEVKHGRGRFAPVAFNYRYLRIALQTAISGATYYEVGTVACIAAPTTAATNYGSPFASLPIDPRLDSPYPGGGFETTSAGPKFWRLGPMVGGLEGGRWRREAATDLAALRALRIGDPWWFDRNDGDASHAYLVKLTQEISKADAGPQGFEAPVVFEEFT